MKQRVCVPLLTLLLVACFAVPVRADSELIPATEVTARYELAPLWKKAVALVYRPTATLEQAETLPLTTGGMVSSMQIETLAAIEPAAGHDEGADAAGDAHADKAADAKPPEAHGSSEGQKSFTGKVIGVSQTLPVVTIGGKPIVTHAATVANDIASTTPEGLKGAGISDVLDRRFMITPYAHSPVRGEATAPIKVVEFVDLSCGQCMPELAKIDVALMEYASSTQVIHIHAPTARFQDTNMPAFYGKVAGRGGVFWVFRENLINDKPVDANAIFEELVKSGMSVPDVRTMMLTEARRFYRELDADSLLARSFGVGKPPVVFVNGIRLGDGGLPLDKLHDVMAYVTARIARGMPEPPK